MREKNKKYTIIDIRGINPISSNIVDKNLILDKHP